MNRIDQSLDAMRWESAVASRGGQDDAGGRACRWLGIKLDQRHLPALRAAAVRGEQEFGGIDILFANAGVQSFHPLLEMEDEDWHITIDVNLTGTANAVRALRLIW